MSLQSRSKLPCIQHVLHVLSNKKSCYNCFRPYSVLDGFCRSRVPCGSCVDSHSLSIQHVSHMLWTPIAFVKVLVLLLQVLVLLQVDPGYLVSSMCCMCCPIKRAAIYCLDHIQCWMGFGDPGFHVEVVWTPILFPSRSWLNLMAWWWTPIAFEKY